MTIEDCRTTVLGWLGKNIGGTIGAPFAWRRQVSEVSYCCLYVTPHWSEDGTDKINMRSGLLPLEGRPTVMLVPVTLLNGNAPLRKGD